MRSHAERFARLVATGALLWLLILALRNGSTPVRDVARSAGLPRALTRWSTAVEPAAVHVHAQEPFTPAARDWLRALDGAGTAVTWDGTGPPSTALVAEPVADPEGGTSAWIAAPSGAALIVEDPAGRLDSIQAVGAGARLRVRSSPSELLAKHGGSAARSRVPDSLTLGRLLLLGRAGWESKFVAAALEERGWKLDARLRLSPRGDVRQGSAAPIDTSRYSAAIVLDSIGVAEGLRLAAFVRSGGGVVLAGLALRDPALAGLSAGSPGTAAPGPEPFDTLAREPRRGLELIPVTPRADAVVLERRGALSAVAARRVERGRVLTTGYVDTWRWRMGGAATSLRDHRDWWAGLVSGVAHTGRIPRPTEGDGQIDEAPRATLIARLGPGSAPAAVAAARFHVSQALLFVILTAGLLFEWASRRLRGAP